VPATATPSAKEKPYGEKEECEEEVGRQEEVGGEAKQPQAAQAAEEVPGGHAEQPEETREAHRDARGSRRAVNAVFKKVAIDALETGLRSGGVAFLEEFLNSLGTPALETVQKTVAKILSARKVVVTQKGNSP
jgi:hypothetical protein